MLCAYCHEPCTPTREHVIPDWYSSITRESETFSARAPLTHLKGDLVVKDVCDICNNGILSQLDNYGKEQFERYFASPVYANESIIFNYDGDKLLRWLLKLSYNSARAQNADTLVLQEYRRIVLGESPVPESIRCWVQLVSPTYFHPEEKVARPALRAEQGSTLVEEPLWFRICQFRLTAFPSLSLVQRMVIINSYAFTLLIARANCSWPCQEFEEWSNSFISAYSDAKQLIPQCGCATMTTGATHTALSLSQTMAHFPSRFMGESNPLVEKVLKGKHGAFLLNIPNELIETGNTGPIVDILHDMVSTREKALAFRERVIPLVDGFDHDPRGIWEFPKAREFFRQLFLQCPFVIFLSAPEGSLTRLFAACWTYTDGMSKENECLGVSDFMRRAFLGLNCLSQRLALSEEQNREICSAAARTLFGENP